MPAYISAFGDEELAFKKAFQALLNNSDHESLDLGGRKISVTAPIDMAAAVPNKTGFSTRRVIRNGQFDVKAARLGIPKHFTSVATYDPSDSTRLTNVANVANIPVGSLVQGSGVGREIYVRSKDVAAGEITLNAPIYDASGTQTLRSRRSNTCWISAASAPCANSAWSRSNFSATAGAARSGWRRRAARSRCRIVLSADPRIAGSHRLGRGCKGMLIDNCQFLSSEESFDVTDRNSIALNTNLERREAAPQPGRPVQAFCGSGRRQQHGSGQSLFPG